MRTNREKYEHYLAQIESRDAAVIAGLIPQGMPSVFHVIHEYEARPVDVTGVRVIRSGIYTPDADTRVTKAELAHIKKISEEWTEPTLDDVFVCYSYRQKYGTVSGAHKYSKISAGGDSFEMMAWKAGDLDAEIERRRALYAPRDGHSPCGYCQKQVPETDLVSRTIFYRDRGGCAQKIGRYCSDQCGYHDQCGHEG